MPHKVAFITHLVCLLSFPLTGVLFILIKYYSFPNWLRVPTLTTYALLCSMQIYIEEDIYLVATLAKLVDSDIQWFADSIRLGNSRLGVLFAFSSFFIQLIDSSCHFFHICYNYCFYCLSISRKNTGKSSCHH